MGELMELSNDLNVITAEINSYKQVAGQAIFEIGKRLKHVKENDMVHGEFGKWLEKIDIDQYDASKFIKAYNEFSYLGMYPNLGQSKIFQIISLPKNIDKEEFINKEHTIPSTGEQKKIDEMTVRELREVKKALKQAEEDKVKLAMQLTEERNKPVHVETKYIEKEIDNTDYETINKLNKQLQQKHKDYELLTNEKQAIESKMKLTEKENEEFQNLKNQIQRLSREKEDIGRQIEAATSISGLVIEIDHLIKGKLAPVKYSKAIQEVQDDEIVIENLSEILKTVQSWCDEMKSYLPNTRKIINMEVL